MTQTKPADQPAEAASPLHERAAVKGKAAAGLRPDDGPRSKSSQATSYKRAGAPAMLDREQVWQWKKIVAALPLSATTRLVGWAIAGHYNFESGRCFPSIGALCKLLRAKDGTVRSAIKALVMAGCLDRSSPNDGKHSGRFTLLFPGGIPDGDPDRDPSPNRGEGSALSTPPRKGPNPSLDGGAPSPRLGETNHEGTGRKNVLKDVLPTPDIKLESAREHALEARVPLSPDEAWVKWHALAEDEQQERNAMENEERSDLLDAHDVDFRDTADTVELPAERRFVLRVGEITEADRKAASGLLWQHIDDSAAILDVISDETLSPELRWEVIRGFYRDQVANDDDAEEGDGAEDRDDSVWGPPDYSPFARAKLDDTDPGGWDDEP